MVACSVPAHEVVMSHDEAEESNSYLCDGICEKQIRYIYIYIYYDVRGTLYLEVHYERSWFKSFAKLSSLV